MARKDAKIARKTYVIVGARKRPTDVRHTGGLGTRVKEGEAISILPAVSGG